MRGAEQRLPLPVLGGRVSRRAMVGVLLANLAGVAFIWSFLTYLLPDESSPRAGSVLADVALTGGYFAVAALFGGVLSNRIVKRAGRWVDEDRPPSAAERRRTLALPRTLALLSFVPWACAPVLFGILSATRLHHSGSHTALEVLGTLDAGLVVCTVAFLLIERAMRPIFVHALMGADPPQRFLGGVRVRLVVTWSLASGVPLLALAFLPLDAGGRTASELAPAISVLAGTGLAVGLMVTRSTARWVAEPLAEARRALQQVQRGDLTAAVAVDRTGDLGALQKGVNEMVAGLREREQLADLFGRHVGEEVAARALAQGSGLESEQREASALFVDIIGSTAMAEVLPPNEVLDTLNAYFGCVVRVVGEEGGWVNKFEGDGALCVFGAPATQPDHASRALRAARRLHAALEELRAAHPGLDAAIGVSSGSLVAGNVGTEARYEYTVIGRPVNEAARLTDVAKGRDRRVLAAGAALARAGDEAARWSSAGTLALRGQSAPTEVFEPAVAAFSRQ